MMWFGVVAINGLAEQLHPLITPPYRAGAVPDMHAVIALTLFLEKINKISSMICRL